MKSPCVKDCPDRMPCGVCRKTCEKFLEYESERLKENKMDVGTITIARKAICRKSIRSAKRNRRHVRRKEDLHCGMKQGEPFLTAMPAKRKGA